MDKLKTELLFASTHRVRAGGKPVKFAEDGFKTGAALHSRQSFRSWLPRGAERGAVSAAFKQSPGDWDIQTQGPQVWRCIKQ